MGYRLIPLSHAKSCWTRLTCSYGPLNSGSTQVSKVGSTLLTLYSWLWFPLTPIPSYLFQNERLLYLTQTVIRWRYAVDSCHDLDSKRSSRILARAVLWRQLRASQAMSIVRHKRWRTARLLYSHMTERRTIRRKTQTINTIFSHYNLLLLRND